jgi:hypothetical protein
MDAHYQVAKKYVWRDFFRELCLTPFSLFARCQQASATPCSWGTVSLLHRFFGLQGEETHDDTANNVLARVVNKTPKPISPAYELQLQQARRAFVQEHYLIMTGRIHIATAAPSAGSQNFRFCLRESLQAFQHIPVHSDEGINYMTLPQ